MSCGPGLILRFYLLLKRVPSLSRRGIVQYNPLILKISCYISAWLVLLCLMQEDVSLSNLSYKGWSAFGYQFCLSRKGSRTKLFPYAGIFYGVGKLQVINTRLWHGEKFVALNQKGDWALLILMLAILLFSPNSFGTCRLRRIPYG